MYKYNLMYEYNLTNYKKYIENTKNLHCWSSWRCRSASAAALFAAAAAAATSSSSFVSSPPSSSDDDSPRSLYSC